MGKVKDSASFWSMSANFYYYVEVSTLTRASGPPGVGKTFTVEATSEYFKLPLYSVGTRRGAC
jgi:Cdc6-like AAA superfamily ATPase